MTSPGKLDQASEDGNEMPRDSRQRHADRFSLPGTRRTWSGILLILIALAGVALIVGGGIRLTASGGTSSVTGGAPASPGSVSTGQVNSSKARVNLPSAAQVAASAGAVTVPTDMRSRVIAWQSGPGGRDLAAVTRQFGEALQAEALKQYAEMKFACTQLAHRLSTAEAGPTIPIAAMQSLYVKALGELAKGAADCQAAIALESGDESLEAIVNAGLRQQAASELATGSKDIFRATAEIEIASR